MTTTKDINVNFLFDGAYFDRGCRHLRSCERKDLDVGKLIDWNLKFIRTLEPDANPVAYHRRVFMGEAAWLDAGREEFLHKLLVAGVENVRRPLKFVDGCFSDGRKGYKEDGIDVLLVSNALYDAKDGQVSYTVFVAGDSDFVPSFDFLRKLGSKVVVNYYDFDKVNPPTSDCIISSADYAVNLECLMHDRKDSLAQAIFAPVGSSSMKPSNCQKIASTQAQVLPLAKKTGNIKFIDSGSGSWGIIETKQNGDYHFSVDSVESKVPLKKGMKVIFTELKPALPNDGSVSRSASNGKAIDVVVDEALETTPIAQSEVQNFSRMDVANLPSTFRLPELELKKLVAGCASRENGFALLAEVGAAYKFKFGKPERPLKEILADYPATFEFCNSPAASVRIIA